VKEIATSQNNKSTETTTEECVSASMDESKSSVCASATPNTSVCETVSSDTVVCESTPSSTDTSRIVVLDKDLRIGPFQTKVVQVKVKGTQVTNLPVVGIVMPSEKSASLQCDFTEGDTSTSGLLAITNWSGEPLAIEQSMTMGVWKKWSLFVKMIQCGLTHQ